MEIKERVSNAAAWARGKVNALVVVATASAAAAPAFAQETGAIDVADVVAKISAQAVPIAAIGAAILVVVVGIAAFRWVRRAISG